MLSDLQLLKKRLPNVIVCGIPDIRSTVLASSQGEDGVERHKVLASGEGMLSVMATPGVKGVETYSNHIMEVRADAPLPSLPPHPMAVTHDSS